MPPVDENGKLNSGRPAEAHDRIECGARCPCGKDNIVNENHRLSDDGERYIASVHHGRLVRFAQIIAVQGYVKLSDGKLFALNALYVVGNALSKRHAPGPDADKTQILRAAVFLDYLMGDADERALDVRIRQYCSLVLHDTLKTTLNSCCLSLR